MKTKGKILVIDDEEIITSLFRRLLPGQGYEFYSAANGPDGLKLMAEINPDLVFLDLKMPDMDGMEVLKKAKDINRDLPIILLTGHGNLDAAVQAIKLGAYDFMQKPIEDLEALLVDVARAVGNYTLIKKNRGLTEELSKVNKGLEKKVKQRTQDLEQSLSELKLVQSKINEEIKTVSIVQQNLLPEGPPKREGLDVAAIYLASAAVGGDYYDYIDMGDDKLGIVIADVSGHGLPAAFVMTMVKIMLLYLNKQKIPFKETVVALNDMLTRHIPTNNFVTMIYGILNFKETTFTYINAGHEPLVHVNVETESLETIPAKSPFLGIDLETNFIENVLRLDKGDKIILSTDGITEACNTQNQVFGEERFKDIITKNMAAPSMKIVTEIISELSDHCTGTSYVDDITLVVLGIT